MKVLITGGAGYLGTELVYQLASREDVSEVIIYDNLSRGNHNLFIGVRKFPQGKVRFVNGDLLDTRKLRQSLKGVDVVYHLAANVTKPFSDHNPHLLEQVNHWGTAELVYAVEQSDVGRFIYSSSSAVYGTSDQVVSYKTTPHPTTYYGISKLRGEEHVERLQSKLPAFIIRTANVYGYSKSMRFDAKINRYMMEAAAGQKITVNGSGDQTRNYIHVDDATRLFDGLLTSSITPATYDLVTRNLKIHEITDGVTQVFPDTELLFINQHIEPWELQVAFDSRLEELLRHPGHDFLDEIRDFRTQFTIDF